MEAMWPTDEPSLVAEQERIAALRPPPWSPPDAEPLVAGCWVCFPRGLTGPGGAGDPAWAAACALRDLTVVEQSLVAGTTGASYVPGLLALRMGPLLEAAVRQLTTRPEVVLLDASARDHPRRAGLALHLGAVLGLPSVGVTHRPLAARGDWPEDVAGAASPLLLGTEVVASWVRTRPGTRPLVVHPGWAVDLEDAVDLVLRVARRRTPEPLRRARELARRARTEAASSGRERQRHAEDPL
jgi:deoxyribonuclease V